MRAEGLEPSALWSEATRSIQLSYTRIFNCPQRIHHNLDDCQSFWHTVAVSEEALKCMHR